MMILSYIGGDLMGGLRNMDSLAVKREGVAYVYKYSYVENIETTPMVIKKISLSFLFFPFFSFLEMYIHSCPVLMRAPTCRIFVPTQDQHRRVLVYESSA